ncbi:hypothetical protein Tsubulata_006055 [Turnera subulata]|uniref:NAC domain-containing protein n=1 Tax=Turnera subulata TaxID=218843 RepID=A0A9Q0JJW8_9ROSI|nr:hypothetical protein Tsubulata_006055 [Turnera subulata]
MAVMAASRGGGEGAAEERWPPGFRFHPTDEELVLYYLKRKMCRKRLKLDIIRETDVYKWDPEDLPGFVVLAPYWDCLGTVVSTVVFLIRYCPCQSVLKTGDRQWFFFSPRDRKYPNGARSNRATGHGYWKATGKDRNVTCNSRNVGVKKTLVFYRGRAPTGLRTDWVMHEYSLDEDELKRCPNVQDYYVLYKVYKKSGPGPKNGEQYGAPFREEDWADDVVAVVKIPVMAEIPVKQHNEVAPVDNARVSAPPQPPIDELDELLKQIADQPAPEQLHNGYHTDELHQVAGDEEAQSTLLDLSPKPGKDMNQQCDAQAYFDFNPSASSNIQSHEASEVTSAPNNLEPVPQLTGEDFLEMDDLIGPAPVLSNVAQPAESFQFDEFDGLSELDLYHDAAMFLRDMGPADHETVSHSFANSFGGEVVNQVDYQMQQNSMNQADHQFQSSLGTNQVDYQYQYQSVSRQEDHQFQQNPISNQVDFQFQPDSVLNQVDCQFHPNSVAHQQFALDQVGNELWFHDQRTNVVTFPESNDRTYSQVAAGVVYNPINNSTAVDANQSGQEGEGDSGGWLSSVLWSFVESIPTTPASASESPLVNKAFQRMSSFSRLRMNAKNTHVDTANVAGDVRKVGGKKRFIFLSVFGAVCALLWVSVGNMRVLGR